jgi:uroporphyrinogen decarboxylase
VDCVQKGRCMGEIPEQGKAERLGSRRELRDSPFLAAARGAPPSRIPVWYMRQAGRSLPEYRDRRGAVGMLEACSDPALVCELTLQPVRRHGVDAAILFSDIMVPLVASGVPLEIRSGVGPTIASPVRSAEDVAAIPSLYAESLAHLGEGLRLLVDELGPTPLIGFAGGPFTLASYLVEGGPSRDHLRTKAMMYAAPDLWHALMRKLTEMAVTSLQVQARAGADAVQLFDSWAGTLSERDYRAFVLPYSAQVFRALADAGIPRIHFGVGTSELLAAMRDAGADVVGVDWRVPLDQAVQRLRTVPPAVPGPVVQGNLDPALLLADDAILLGEADRVVESGRCAQGHIFNLGHGVPPEAPPDRISRLTDHIHALTPR